MTEFKEKNKDEQYYKDDSGNWIKTDEATISSLWNIWIGAKGVHRYKDNEGFTVFAYKNES